MRRPILSQPTKCGGRNRNLAILGTLAAVYVNQSTGSINVPDLQMQTFFESQSHGVHGPQVDSDSLDLAGGDDLMDLRDRQHLRKRLGVGNLDLPQGRPVSLASVQIEESDAIKGDSQ